MSLILQLTAAEILAKAALRLFPGAILIHLHVDAAGFSYDIAFSQQVDIHALPLLEENIRELIKEEIPLQVLDMMRENAVHLFEHHLQPIKADQVAKAKYNIVQIIKVDDFYDYSPLPEISDLQKNPSGFTGAIKIFSIEEKLGLKSLFDNTKVMAISGTAAENKQSLKKQIKKHEDARRNHPLRLGSDMNLFSFDSKLGSDVLFWHPKGVFLRDALIRFWQEDSKRQQFQFVITPSAIPSEISYTYKTLDSPLCSIETSECLAIQDKNSLLAYYLARHSYSCDEFPVRLAEWSSKMEISSWWNEPAAPRFQSTGYRQIYCLEKQMQQEIISSLQFFDKIITMLGFRGQWVILVPKGKFSAKNLFDGNQSLKHLKEALFSCGHFFTEESRLSLAGPRIELQVKDKLDRSWTLSTLEINLAYTQYLALHYRGNEKKYHPFLICESLFTSLERVIILLLQNTEGVLPFQLAPEQIRILPIGKQSLAYAHKVSNQLNEALFRVGIDMKEDSLGHKIHRAEKEKIPYQVIVGEQEAKEKKVAIRSYGQKALKKRVSVEAFIQECVRI